MSDKTQGRQNVKPIRDKKIIQRVKDAMRAEEDYKFLALFVLGINTGLRISDLLRLKWDDVYVKGKFLSRIVIKEKKTGKPNEIPLGKTIIDILKEYKAHTTTEGYLFPTEKNPKRGELDKAMSYQYVYRRLNYYIRERAGFTEAVGCHTLRKTFGYQAYIAGWDIYRIQECLNHSSPSITRRYIDLSQDDKDQVYASLNL
jgi:integrase